MCENRRSSDCNPSYRGCMHHRGWEPNSTSCNNSSNKHMRSKWPTTPPRWTPCRVQIHRCIGCCNKCARPPTKPTLGLTGHHILEENPESMLDSWALLCP